MSQLPIFYQQKEKLFFGNGVYLGDILTDVDGYKKWWPDLRPGYLDEMFLFALATYLKTLNAEWDAQCQGECK